MNALTMLEKLDRINSREHTTKPHKKSRSSFVPRSPKQTPHLFPFQATPYNFEGKTVYIALVDAFGNFYSSFKPKHFVLMQRTRGKEWWMKSAIKEKSKTYYVVALNSFGDIIDGTCPPS
ncbi:hypothetical protein EIN_129880 [Entamoeba invadens IP1]|uniref:Uncharacterized protein n=1 Tax=Entamoeba invadens IP1 TaxID=370355 RepID=L7FMI9_ENTIV|nr:hypothetical protein EIN_129880 [Entamoeba invadens IP1]ELP91608.1 hypothetical protein EIN_129880 [Entamoeba invadens IP1]|eukprot:XP_004258379.1 hypothetical protein EIN_129880 [Entamoeba invadens IP1]